MAENVTDIMVEENAESPKRETPLGKVVIYISLFMISCVGSPQSDDLIIGKWNEIKRERRDGKDTGANGKPYFVALKLQFFKDGTVYDDWSKTSANYEVRNGFLYVGDRKYKIEKLTSNELVLLEYNDRDPDYWLAFRSYYKKVD